MSVWIEIPAHRILEVSRVELTADWECLNAEGLPARQNDEVYRLLRKLDGKVFKPASFHPASCLAKNCYYLEEI